MKAPTPSKFKVGTSIGVVLAAAMAFSSANAEIMYSWNDCSATSLDKVTNTGGTASAVTDCEYLAPANPSTVANLANINGFGGLFGYTDWEENGQTQIDPPAGTGDDWLSGDWSILNPDFANHDYAIVFKDGSDTNLIGFLFSEMYASGDWTSPFTDPPFTFGDKDANKTKGTSHYTIVKRGGGMQVAEPGTLGLLGLALFAAGYSRRRR